MTTKKKDTARFSPAERRNWGYWDGKAAHLMRRYPTWAPARSYEAPHPTDKVYGEAFWKGWRGEAHPNEAGR